MREWGTFRHSRKYRSLCGESFNRTFPGELNNKWWLEKSIKLWVGLCCNTSSECLNCDRLCVYRIYCTWAIKSNRCFTFNSSQWKFEHLTSSVSYIHHNIYLIYQTLVIISNTVQQKFKSEMIRVRLSLDTCTVIHFFLAAGWTAHFSLLSVDPWKTSPWPLPTWSWPLSSQQKEVERLNPANQQVNHLFLQLRPVHSDVFSKLCYDAHARWTSAKLNLSTDPTVLLVATGLLMSR